MAFETKFLTGQRLRQEVFTFGLYRAHIHKDNNLTSFLPLEQIYDQV